MVLLVLATKYLYIIALYLIIDNLAITYGSLAREVFPDVTQTTLEVGRDADLQARAC